jgi:twitching motility protein PilI
MARRDALRDLQARLAERMQNARDEAPGSGWLAVECAGHGFVLPLQQAGEIFPTTPWVPVPHTQAWFLGVANLRGVLHGVVDLAAFLGLARAGHARGEQSRLVALGPSLQANVALLVDRLAGLRSAAQMAKLEEADPRAPAFAAGQRVDGDGRRWQALDLAALTADEHFLKILGHGEG